MQTRGHRETGMTLIEIMMVVVIIGILTAVLVPTLINRGDEARITAQKVQLRGIGNALIMYKMHNGRYPSTDQGLQALVTKPGGTPEPRNWGPNPYLPKYPVDQWGNEFVYVGESSKFELLSLGADGTDGGEGEDADISYADL